MKEEVNEVRVKLHITSTGESPDVNNLWMCLNYDHKPTIGHVIEHIKKNYCTSSYWSAAEKNATAANNNKQPAAGGKRSDDQQVQVKLFLDDFWLPPYENSRLIRENDCIKAIVEKQVDQGGNKDLFSAASHLQLTKKMQNSRKFNDAATFGDKQAADSSEYFNSYFDNYLSQFSSQTNNYLTAEKTNAKPKQNSLLGDDNEPSLFTNGKEGKVNGAQSSKSSNQKSDLNESTASSSAPEQVSAAKAANKGKANGGDESVKSAQSNTVSSSIVNSRQCYKKFSVGAYVHLLNEENQAPAVAASVENQESEQQQQQQDKENEGQKNKKSKNKRRNRKNRNNSGGKDDDQMSENLSGEQVIDSYYESLSSKDLPKSKKKQDKQKQQQQAQQTVSNDVDLDQIASKINATGKSKWKNSNKPTSSNGPKHIVFPSTSSETTNSSTDSDEEKKKEKKGKNKKTEKSQEQAPETSEQQQQQQQQEAPKKAEAEKNNVKQNKRNKYYEPSKEEQLNVVSYNRTFVIQNPKSLAEFKKIFNETKLNAPKAEEFMVQQQQQQPQQQQDSARTGGSIDIVEKFYNDLVNDKAESKKASGEHLVVELNESSNSSMVSTSSSSSSNTADSSLNTCNDSICSNGDDEKAKKRSSRRRRSTDKYDYEKLEALNGAPRVGDHLAFQILEISSNFTPEVSAYKNGSVVDFDAVNNEVTLKLNENHKYNSVLRRSNKFSVVFEETEELSKVDLLSKEDVSEKSSEEAEVDNIIKVDWRNLMNVKVIPAKKPEQYKAESATVLSGVENQPVEIMQQ